jgi:small-conductance mechanosensitive channel
MSPGWLLAKYAITAGLVVLISELAKRSGKLGALLTALPIVTLLVLIWMHAERSAPAKIADYARYTFWYVLATLPMFALLPTLLARCGFWGALATGALVTVGCVLLLAVLGRPFGLRLW